MKNELMHTIFDQNPVFRLALGLCPAIAMTVSTQNAAIMGVCVLCVLIASNIVVSLSKKWVPARVRVSFHIIVAATFASMADIIVKASLSKYQDDQFWLYVPLVAVNSLVLSRADIFASKNKTPASILDGLVMGTAFTAALVLCAVVRELLGGFGLFGKLVLPAGDPFLVFRYACGGFFSAACVLGIVNFLRLRKEKADTK